jgi:hypothetical protein
MSFRNARDVLALAPGDLSVDLAVEVRRPLPEEQELMVRWRDADDEHTESAGINPPGSGPSRG